MMLLLEQLSKLGSMLKLKHLNLFMMHVYHATSSVAQILNFEGINLLPCHKTVQKYSYFQDFVSEDLINRTFEELIESGRRMLLSKGPHDWLRISLPNRLRWILILIYNYYSYEIEDFFKKWFGQEGNHHSLLQISFVG